jgi:hypothetical protein
LVGGYTQNNAIDTSHGLGLWGTGASLSVSISAPGTAIAPLNWASNGLGYGEADYFSTPLDFTVAGTMSRGVTILYNMTASAWTSNDTGPLDANGTLSLTGLTVDTPLGEMTPEAAGYTVSFGDGRPSPDVVPEPSSIVLLGFGAVSLLACAWRRRGRMA